MASRSRKRRRAQQVVRRAVGELGIEPLESRAMLSISAMMLPGSGQLTIYGDELANTIEVSRDVAGTLLINNGAVRVKGGTPTVANITRIFIHGGNGDDTLTLNEANGALPRGQIFGGSGNDALGGGSGADQLFGQAGNDTLLGRGGLDQLFGGSDQDSLAGGDGDDQVYGESGDDQLIWNPGDDSDFIEGGLGIDTVEVNGGNGAEQFAVTANGTRVRFDRLDPAPFALDIAAEQLLARLQGGDDQFSAVGNLAPLIQLTVEGGSGNDVILGSNGADQLRGGAGNDFLDGQQGNDALAGDEGNDLFQWDPGDGNDQIAGGADSDQLVFNGSNAGEIIEASSVGGSLQLVRNIGGIALAAAEVEHVNLRTLGSADTVIVNDLAGSGVTQFAIDLASQLGGSQGDGQADQVVVRGTSGADVLAVFGAGSAYSVTGLSAVLSVANSEGTTDSLTVAGLAGNDGLSAATVPAGVVKLTLDGGSGDDELVGSAAADLLLGGDDADFLAAGQGSDVVFAGSGNDQFQWVPGDGSDTLEGQAGNDALLLFGANIGENIQIVANGGRVLLSRDVANISLDLDDTERIEVRAGDGTDSLTIGDLSGTDLLQVDLDLRGGNGGGDGAADVVTVLGTQNADTLGAAGDAGGVAVFGLQTTVHIFQTEAALDRLVLNGLGGDDVLDATSLEADALQLSLLGGLGADLLRGSAGNDEAVGGDGNDVALLGEGDDRFVWNPGDDNDTVEGQAGSDLLQFNGANVAENIGLTANGGRVSLTRDVAAITLDLNAVETLALRLLGGADTVTLGDLSGTAVGDVQLDFTASGGGGDGQADAVVVSGTGHDDVLTLNGDAGTAIILGLSTQISLLGCEAANDQLLILTLDGDDVVEASGLTATVLQLTADGGQGADVLIGSDGNDVLFGAEGDDVLLGGPGLDVLNGGLGEDIEIQ